MFDNRSPLRRTSHRDWIVHTTTAWLYLLLIGAGGLAACAPAQESPPTPQAPTVTLDWTDCQDGFQCATAQVPLDYDEPTAEKISLAVIRMPATDPSQRRGSLFINPGGPGDSGVSHVRLFGPATYPEGLRRHFDLVSFDPRGVGQSTPVQCFASAEEQAAFPGNNPQVPVRADQVGPFIETRKDYAARCAERNGDLLNHTSSANVARDMDLLREAVGEDRLTFLGKSYGSYLGMTYASMFPDRVGPMVLDGITDPVGYTGTATPETGTPWLRSDAHLGAEETLKQFLQLCGKAGANCPFGSGGNPEEKFADLVKQLTDTPLLVDYGTGTPVELGADGVLATVLTGIYFPTQWSNTAKTLQQYWQFAQLPVGTVHTMPASGGEDAGGPANAGYVNFQDAQSASICVDGAHPSIEGLIEAAEQAEQEAPYAAGRWAWGISGVCPFWTGADEDRYTGPFTPTTATPILAVSNRYDPATPYSNGERLASTVPGAGLLTFEGWGHTSVFFGFSTCLDEAVTDYLLTGELPPDNTRCKPEPQAVPFANPPTN